MSHLLKIFTDNMSKKVYTTTTPYDEGVVDFTGCWRYYRMSSFPDSEGVKSFTEEQKRHAMSLKDVWNDKANMLKPLFECITSGKGNEGIGIFGKSEKKKLGCIIIREGPDKYAILTMNVNNLPKDLDKVLLVTSGF